MTPPLSDEQKQHNAEERRRRAADQSWHGSFLAKLQQCGNVTRACKTVDITRTTAYEHRDLFPDFAEAWDAAQDLHTATLIEEAQRRAVEGTLEPVFYQGAIAGAKTIYSDSLLMFLIKQRDPSFRDTHRVEHANADGKPLEISDTTRAAAQQELNQWREQVNQDIQQQIAGLSNLLNQPPT